MQHDTRQHKYNTTRDIALYGMTWHDMTLYHILTLLIYVYIYTHIILIILLLLLIIIIKHNIYIYIERERDVYIHMCIYIHIYTYPSRGGGRPVAAVPVQVPAQPPAAGLNERTYKYYY